MARTNNLTNFLTDVASAIKTKTGDNTAIPASQFDTKIAGITTGKLSNEEYTKANNDLDNILSGNENVLPNTYQEVEYLESTGTQYIDTGYAFTEPELKIEAKYRKTSTLSCNVFGLDFYPNTPRKIHGNIYNKALYLGNSSVVTNITQALNEDYIFKFEFKNNVAKWLVNGTEYTYNGANGWEGVSDGETDYLFATRGLNGPGYVYTGRIYYVKFYDNNGDLVRNFVPCYRKLDDKPGMYDTVNNVFYTNEGTGDFIVGADVDVLNTKIESVLTEKNTKIIPTNIKKDVNILGVTGTYEGSSGYPPDWSQIGYEDTPQSIIDEFNIAKQIYDNWDNTTTNMLEMFRGRKDLFILPPIDTSNVTNMNSTFYGSVINVLPVLDTGNVTGLYDTFKSCNSLTPDSLNNIMKMCINATNYTSTKTLKQIGLSQAQATTCQSLSNYQDFINAGWTTGY